MYSKSLNDLEIMNGMDDYSCAEEIHPVGAGVTSLAERASDRNLYLQFQEIMVVDSNGLLVGMLDVTTVMLRFFPSVPGTSSNDLSIGKKISYTDFSQLMDDHLYVESEEQPEKPLCQYSPSGHRAVSSPMEDFYSPGIAVNN